MRLAAFVLLVCSLSQNLFAAASQFPYEAVVQSDDVEVRSGPGSSYYPTGKLKANSPVTVHRHDPGGWYMISPPPGSFSYIDARFVQASGATGVIQVTPNEDGKAPRAIVRIGSELGDDHAYYGRQLNNGDTVQILGERTLTTDHGAATMLMIVPPAREYRWVKGDFVVAADSAVRQQKAADPYADPLVAAGLKRPTVTAEAAPLPAPARAVRSAAVESVEPSAADQNRARVAMKEVDRRYLDMVALPPAEWDIGSIEEAYRAAQKDASPELAEQIENRIRALAERRKLQDEFQEFVRLTSATNQKDAELAALQANPQVMTTPDPASLEAATEALPADAIPVESAVSPMGLPVITQSPAGPTLPTQASVTTPFSSQAAPESIQVTPILPRGEAAPSAALQPTSPGRDSAPVTPQLNGAGFVQRAPNRPGSPRYMLIAPTGKFLTYLDPAPGVNLEAAVGQPMGVIGRRFFEPSVRAEMIVVRQMMPVQLQ
jgi:hypothetical protein